MSVAVEIITDVTDPKAHIHEIKVKRKLSSLELAEFIVQASAVLRSAMAGKNE